MDGEADFEADDEVDGGVDKETDTEGNDETHVLARVGSTGSLDHIDEDFNRTAASQATGFMGKNSELAWMQRLKKQADPVGQTAMLISKKLDARMNPASLQENLHYPINESTYHCDDLSMLVPNRVEPFEVPPRQTADMLFEFYLDTVHPAFPIIGKTTFFAQYDTYYSKNV